ncbi:cyclopropane-fatty-acyl-phospholipid synthase family protein [Roseomonas sp. AR75]|jgi:cyclopropane-fatty-acyl-phospholipid synthase|uniref:SAM-dependent methyltransferase n=1 Tax=Roseomonas sp. AR75 TaxID=2562311 RepID=UPI0010C0A566|nr:cyclopropane-fatty-acyl-phospholipid synthase family protein [Roseomonas sp. AR75]
MFRRLFDSAMAGFVLHGRLTVHYADGAVAQFGPGDGPEAAFRLRDAAATRRLVLNPALAMGELYMDGGLEPVGCDIGALVELLVLNHWQGGSHPMDRLLSMVRQAKRRLDQLNPVPRARRNVAHHYDLDRRLFSLFLDRDMQYSCAYYARGDETLDEAQIAKKRHIAAKLRLDRPGLEVLEIGCGWGGMAMTLARDWGARVTGITLSQEQLEVARQRAAEAGLSDRCRFALMDYRAWDRKVDRVLSVGMFEAVGLLHFRRYFGVIRDAMKPDGVALVHAIGRAAGPANTNPWLAKYIFPGGYSPALSEVVPAVEKAGLWITDLEILRLHYAMTIAEWRRRFAAKRDAIQSLYDERFCRMFEFYLAGCEFTFRHGDHMNWQIQLTRERMALPLTRDWIMEAERRAAAGTILPAIHTHPQAEGGAATRAAV